MINQNLIPVNQELFNTTHRRSHAQIKEIDKRYVRFDHIQPKAKIEEVLPFRVQFINVGVFGYSKNNPPPIPLQIIGYSNYIL
jgi:hypothetical protein